MKLSVSLPDEDVELLDEHARRRGLPSRSAAVRDALRVLRNSTLDEDYAAAWAEWDASGNRAAWESVTADGVS